MRYQSISMMDYLIKTLMIKDMEKYNAELFGKCRKTDWKKTLEAKGYKYFVKGDYNLNLIGVRSNKQGNEFNDYFICEYWNKSGNKYTLIYPCTTDPGYKSLVNPVNIKGTAILVPNQYLGTWKIGYHKGQYKALVQCKPVEVYRDNTKDYYLDLDPRTIDKGMFGINIHKAGDASTIVDGWSAGCIVLARKFDFNEIMNLVEQSAAIYGDKFTFTLIEEKDLKE